MVRINSDPIIVLIHQRNMIIIFDRRELIAKHHLYDQLTLSIVHSNLRNTIKFRSNIVRKVSYHMHRMDRLQNSEYSIQI
jgi:hypothetical protein